MLVQARALRSAGVKTDIGCERGALRFLFRTGERARRFSRSRARKLRPAPEWTIVDHGLCVPSADLVFVHLLAIEASCHVDSGGWRPQIDAERAFFAELRPDAPLVANSQQTKAALMRHFGFAAERVIVHRPGHRSDRFSVEQAAKLRVPARKALAIDPEVALVGFVTSGDFATRGLDLFLESAVRIAAARPDVRFLVVGSKALPEWARRHRLVRDGRLLHRPKAARPERWFAALDLFLYAARYDAFGLVIAEAQASGLPIVTSRAVGAVECLAPAYDRWLIERPDSVELAQRALALLADPVTRRELALAGIAHAAAHDHRAYAAESVATILAQKRRLK
jgi:UDP-glucose:(heptosyl)LPS alpha-1,3-glucosyltransferase